KRLFARLRLQVNEAKSTVARAWERKFLGYSFWVAAGRVIRPRVAPAALAEMKARVRDITSRNGGRSMAVVIAELRSYLTGWKLYFQLAETPRIFEDLDKWLRHRLRTVQLKQWKRGTTAYRELRARGVSDVTAREGAAHVRHWRAAGLHRLFAGAAPIVLLPVAVASCSSYAAMRGRTVKLMPRRFSAASRRNALDSRTGRPASQRAMVRSSQNESSASRRRSWMVSCRVLRFMPAT